MWLEPVSKIDRTQPERGACEAATRHCTVSKARSNAGGNNVLASAGTFEVRSSANAFAKEGTTIAFGLLGSSQLTWWPAMATKPGVKMIDMREEGAALVMAQGWPRSTCAHAR